MMNLATQFPRIPKICFWEITDACNLRCIHCEADAGVKAKDELTTEEALDFCKQIAQTGCKTVNLTGGEPLLRSDWPLIAQELGSLGLEVTVITNGSYISKKNIDKMIEVGVSGVSVSLDGKREVHDSIRRPAVVRQGFSSFDQVFEALELLQKSPLKTAVITQIHKKNLDEFEDLYELISKLSADVWQVQLAMPLGRLWKLREEYLIKPSQIEGLCQRIAVLIKAKKHQKPTIAVADNIGYYSREEPILRGSAFNEKSFWMGCFAGCQVVALCSNGDVKGCPSHPREFFAGNIRDKPFAEIWADGDRKFAYNTEWNPELLEGYCRTCPYAKICRAGCTTMAFASTGTIYDNPFCVQKHCQNPEESRS